MQRKRATAFACRLVLITQLSACAQEAPDSCLGDGTLETREQALLGATHTERYLALSQQQVATIGIIHPRGFSDGSQGICTATRIAPKWALTAAHCAKLGNATFNTGDYETTHIEQWILHPHLDVALIRLNQDECRSPAPMPIASREHKLATGRRVVLSGFGLPEMGTLGFIVEPIFQFTPEEIVVDGLGRSGACNGDSGGPMLLRDREGNASVVAVLSRGDASCTGRDIYIRVDGLDDWLLQHVEPPPHAAPCGGIDQRGRCFDNQAIWCGNGALQAESCAEDTRCGWLNDQQRVGCSTDPACPGDEFGHCDSAGRAVFCDAGVLRIEECRKPTFTCQYDVQTGAAGCH